MHLYALKTMTLGREPDRHAPLNNPRRERRRPEALLTRWVFPRWPTRLTSTS